MSKVNLDGETMITKTCNKCILSKPLALFSLSSTSKDGRQRTCKACQSKRYHENRDRELAKKADWREKNKNYASEYSAKHHAKTYTTNRGRAKSLLQGAKRRAKAKGMDFDLDLSFVEALIESTPTCPLLGVSIKLDVGRGIQQESPSLDRIDNSKGYTKDNVWLISWIANKIKGELSLAELLSFANALTDSIPELYHRIDEHGS